MLELLAVGVGGFVGSCLRFGLSKGLAPFGEVFPFGTLLSNALAGLLIGFVIGMGVTSHPKVRLMLTTGLCGGLSTFSTFSVETLTLFGDGRYGAAALNLLLNLGVSFLGVTVGMAAAKAFARTA